MTMYSVVLIGKIRDGWAEFRPEHRLYWCPGPKGLGPTPGGPSFSTRDANALRYTSRKLAEMAIEMFWPDMQKRFRSVANMKPVVVEYTPVPSEFVYCSPQFGYK